MRARALARGAGELLITLGLLVLLFVGWQLWWTDVVSGRDQAATTGRLERAWRAASGPTATEPAIKEQAVADLAPGTAFAVLRVPRFGAGYARPVLQGTDPAQLDEGVGHYPDSAAPGEVGNLALAGHRVTYGKPFGEIARLRAGDAVVVETRTTWFVYRVVRHVVVTPDRVDVVAPVPERPGVAPTARMLTMTACHPRFSARERYVVFSQLDQTIAKTGGAVPDVLAATAR